MEPEDMGNCPVITQVKNIILDLALHIMVSVENSSNYFLNHSTFVSVLSSKVSIYDSMGVK